MEVGGAGNGRWWRESQRLTSFFTEEEKVDGLNGGGEGRVFQKGEGKRVEKVPFFRKEKQTRFRSNVFGF